MKVLRYIGEILFMIFAFLALIVLLIFTKMDDKQYEQF